MKVIFTKDVPGVARRNDVKDVSDGYARNFLFLKGFARVATEGALKTREKEIAERGKKGVLGLNQAQALAERLKTLTLRFKMKVGEKGTSFGSVSASRIQDELHKKGISVEKEAIELDESIKTLGEKMVVVRFTPEVSEGIKIIVEAEEAPKKQKKKK